MSHFVQQVSKDMRAGRQSWRVFFVMSGMSFTIAALHVVVRIA